MHEAHEEGIDAHFRGENQESAVEYLELRSWKANYLYNYSFVNERVKFLCKLTENSSENY